MFIEQLLHAIYCDNGIISHFKVIYCLPQKLNYFKDSLPGLPVPGRGPKWLDSRGRLPVHDPYGRELGTRGGLAI